jgi:hypothetical protein
MAVPNSRYTSIPVIAMIFPNNHTRSDMPTLPVNLKITLGVAKMPVPMMRLKMRNVALTMPIFRRSGGDTAAPMLSPISPNKPQISH